MNERYEALRVNLENKEYVQARNKLIRGAEKHAYEAAGPKPAGKDVDDWCNNWNQAFHREMDRMARFTGVL